MILEPSAAQPVIEAIDAAHPSWRQVGIPLHPPDRVESPAIIDVLIGGTRHAVAAGATSEVFGNGRLGMAHAWSKDGPGCAVVGYASLLDAMELTELPGYVHLHLLGRFLSPHVSGPDSEALAHFREFPRCYSAFFPVTFRRNPSATIYPWRAHRRDLPASS